jgi:hypothetical protein
MCRHLQAAISFEVCIGCCEAAPEACRRPPLPTWQAKEDCLLALHNLANWHGAWCISTILKNVHILQSSSQGIASGQKHDLPESES